MKVYYRCFSFINWNSYPTAHCAVTQWKQLWSSILSCPSRGCVVHWKSTNVLQKLIFLILTAEEQAKQETGIKQAAGCKQYLRHLPATCFMLDSRIRSSKTSATFNGLQGIISQKTTLYNHQWENLRLYKSEVGNILLNI
jgi:hypothetical protein